MISPTSVCMDLAKESGQHNHESGFTLIEFLVSSAIVMILSAAIFTMLSEIERTAGYQTEIQAVLDNTRIAMQVVERYVRQAGNDPHQCGLTGISFVSPTEVRIQSDLTGSAGTGNPDKGDPDGDTKDSGENLAIRYNNSAQTLEIVSENGSAQIVAGLISGFSLQYFDADGNITNVGNEVRKIRVTISGSSVQQDPRTHKRFGLQLISDVRILV
jgi:type II secretory pathway component PulJ